jgi:hypothetical protein
MPSLIIPSVIGTPPFFIYLCDCAQINCYQIPPLTGVNIPPAFQFNIPSQLSAETCVFLRVIDSLNCEFEQEINFGPQGNTLWQRFPVIPGITPTPTLTTNYIPPTPSVTKTPTPTPTPSLTSNFQSLVVYVHIPNI